MTPGPTPHDPRLQELLSEIAGGQRPTTDQALQLADCGSIEELYEAAATVRDRGHGRRVSYSRKVFIPLTHLCRDICSYCVFAQPPRPGEPAYLSLDQVLGIAQRGQDAGCQEALFTLGDKPEERWSAAREQLTALGHESTLSYLREAAELVLRETSLLPHLNPGLLTAADFAALRPVAPSMGIMLESLSPRLMEKGAVHYGCPDKDPAARLETLRLAGEAAVPFTSGILIGIGETRRERVEALLALRDLNERYGHIQEVIVQNFRAKAATRMANAAEPTTDDLRWTIAVARLILGPLMNIQAPPNLSSPESLTALVGAGINDWGGVSPVTPDFVNPEAPWPEVEALSRSTERAGKVLVPRLTIYPEYVIGADRWVDTALRTALLHAADSEGYARNETWSPGKVVEPPATTLFLLPNRRSTTANGNAAPDEGFPRSSPSNSHLGAIVDRARAGQRLSEEEVVKLFGARGPDFTEVCRAADALRTEVNGDRVTYVTNRNINYTNVCYFRCQFCAFSKGKLSENLRGKPYDLDREEIARRTAEAWERGATEVCLQGGIHPDYTGDTYLAILRTVKETAPAIHVHAFSPLEVWQGAATSNRTVEDFLRALVEEGLGSLPGTAAEILDDEVRSVLCPDKIRTEQWLSVMETAHGVGLRSTATIMFGHIERPVHWARHLLRVRDLQERTGGFTEFVPLPFVAEEAPIFLKGKARYGPTFRESILMHAVARLALHPLITNIQTSWVKLGPNGLRACLEAGVNDVGGTLMNESITRAAGAAFGEEMPPESIEDLIRSLDRTAAQRTTLYGEPPIERIARSFGASPLAAVVNTPAHKYQRMSQS